MGTKFQTMLAPIGLSTGDGRRFAEGGITLADLPFAFEWVRSREGGHDGAVSIGTVQEAAVLTVKEAVAQGFVSADKAKGLDQAMTAVWARGELHDGVDRERMPRLAEDVAEAMHLIEAGTLGPSVDLDTFEGVPVIEGTDDPVDWDMIEEHMDANDGEEPKIELLVTEGRVRAATLVSIPAFAETSRPLELTIDTEPQDEAAESEKAAALIASVATAALPPVAHFDVQGLTGPTPITFDFETGRVFGHIATWQTCHVGYADVCVTAPREEGASAYSWFNRHPVETEDGGTVWAGRITVGGRHAGLELNASSAMAAYDAKVTAADVRVSEDQFGLVVAGHLRPDLSERDKATLARRKVSGDWRETPGGLSLVEVLALSPGPRAHSEPGFPVETFSRHGRQVALTASLGPEPGAFTSKPVDVAAVVRATLAAQREEEARTVALTELKATLHNQQAAEAADSRAFLLAMIGGQ